MIVYLKHKQIDKKKWDECIHHSVNGLIYGLTWYLDIVSPGWEALVENDYESVMPLPVKQKYFIPYLIQPLYTQQLGIFSIHSRISPEKVKVFLHRIPGKFVWRDFNLNSQNPATSLRRILNRHNYELNLTSDYQTISREYNENTKRNLKKALQAVITIEVMNETNFFLEFYKTHAKIKSKAIALEQLKGIMEYSINNNCGEIIIARNCYGQIMAGAFFIKALRRIIYLTSFNTDEGQQNSAMFLVMNEMIKKHAMQPLVFDFEGSMIPGIARFFAGFGAEKITYSRYRHCLIPFKKGEEYHSYFWHRF